MKLTKSQDTIVNTLLDNLNIVLEGVKSKGILFDNVDIQVQEGVNYPWLPKHNVIKAILKKDEIKLICINQIVTKRGKLLDNPEGAKSILTSEDISEIL